MVSGCGQYIIVVVVDLFVLLIYGWSAICDLGRLSAVAMNSCAGSGMTFYGPRHAVLLTVRLGFLAHIWFCTSVGLGLATVRQAVKVVADTRTGAAIGRIVLFKGVTHVFMRPISIRVSFRYEGYTSMYVYICYLYTALLFPEAYAQQWPDQLCEMSCLIVTSLLYTFITIPHGRSSRTQAGFRA
jgi:hypothetical protein